jgi:hypothetical protein
MTIIQDGRANVFGERIDMPFFLFISNHANFDTSWSTQYVSCASAAVETRMAASVTVTVNYTSNENLGVVHKACIWLLNIE